MILTIFPFYSYKYKTTTPILDIKKEGYAQSIPPLNYSSLKNITRLP